MKNSLLLFMTFAFLAACSQAGKTPASFEVSIGGLSAGGNAINKIMITGQTPSGKRFARVLTDGTDKISLSLPNDTWNFLAMAWEDGDLMDGKIRCAAQSTVLNGTDTVVNFSLTNAKCFGTDITTAAPIGAAPNLQYRQSIWNLCEGSISSYDGSQTCAFDYATAKPDFSFVGSVRVGLRGGVQMVGGEFVPNNEWLGTGCTTNENIGDIDARFPVVKPQFFMPLVVEAFNGIACSDAAGKVVASIANQNLVTFGHLSSMHAYASLPAMKVCAAANAKGVSTITAIGQGTVNAPYAICNFNQLRHWQQNWTANATKHVALLTNIDLLPYVKLGSVSGTTPYAACLKDGSTFVPMGLDHSDCLTSHSIPFTGGFHGLGHTIKHFRYEVDNGNDAIGFFNNADAMISHVTFEKPEVRGHNFIGVVVGLASSMTANQIRGIKIIDGLVEGNDYVGMIAGWTGSASEGLTVNGQVDGNQYVGGMYGRADGLVSKAFFDGHVRGDDNHVGGILGQGNVSQAIKKGLVEGRHYVGGIIGSGAGVEDVRVEGSIISHSNAPNGYFLGGIGGSISSSATRTLLIGNVKKVSNACSSSCNVGVVAGDNSASRSLTHFVGLNSADGGSIAQATFDIARADQATMWTNLCTHANWRCVDLDSDGALDAGDGMDIPRLAFESAHPCSEPANYASVATQSATRGGSGQQPIALCRDDQLDELRASTNCSKNYKLLQDVSMYFLDSQGDYAICPTSFSGTFDGQGRMLHNMTAVKGTPNFALFTNNIGTIKNVTFSNVNLHATSTTDISLIGDNSGTIENVRTFGVYINGNIDVGGLVKTNSGTISDVIFEGVVKGESYVGGVVLSNEAAGTVTKVKSKAQILFKDGSPAGGDSHFGGIVAHNAGTLTRSSFAGTMDFSSDNDWDVANVGGLVGENDEGIVTHSMVESEALIGLPGAVLNGGGLIGSMNNSGSASNISYLINDGTVIASASYNTGTNEASAFMGYLNGSLSGTTISVATKPGLDIPARAPVNTGTYTSPTCTMTLSAFDYGSDPGDGTYLIRPSGGAPFLAAWTSGSLTHDPVDGLKGCPTSGASLNFYTPFGPTFTPLTLTDYTNGGFNMVNFDVDSAARNTLLLAYKNHITGQTVGTTPIWIYEDGRMKLFRFDD